jgi:hypothetical protein
MRAARKRSFVVGTWLAGLALLVQSLLPLLLAVEISLAVSGALPVGAAAVSPEHMDCHDEDGSPPPAPPHHRHHACPLCLAVATAAQAAAAPLAPPLAFPSGRAIALPPGQDSTVFGAAYALPYQARAPPIV